MEKNQSKAMLVGLVVVAAIGLPYYLSSQKAAALNAKTAAVRSEEKAFRDKSALGVKLRKAAPEWNKTRDQLAAAMPAAADVQGAIRTLQALTDGDAAPDHVKWLQGSASNVVSVKAPTAVTTAAKPGAKPSASTSTPLTTAAVNAALDASAPPPTGGFDMSISVSGSRNKVLAFVTKLQHPDKGTRMFAVKSVSLSTDAQVGAGAGAAASPTVAAAADGNVLVKAAIQLKVTTFGLAPAADAVTEPKVVPAGAQTTVATPVAPTTTAKP
jgi:hypothetical protein